MAGGPATVPANAVLLSIKRRGRHFRAKWQSSIEFESHACLPACLPVQSLPWIPAFPLPVWRLPARPPWCLPALATELALDSPIWIWTSDRIRCLQLQSLSLPRTRWSTPACCCALDWIYSRLPGCHCLAFFFRHLVLVLPPLPSLVCSSNSLSLRASNYILAISDFN
jgi:hypothetical protein